MLCAMGQHRDVIMGYQEKFQTPCVGVGKWRDGDSPACSAGSGSVGEKKHQGQDMFLGRLTHVVWILNWTTAVVLGKAVLELADSWPCCLLTACQTLGEPSLPLLPWWRSWGAWRRWPFPAATAAVLLSSPSLQQQEQQTLLFFTALNLSLPPWLSALPLCKGKKGQFLASPPAVGWQHSLLSVWQRTLYLTHNLIMMSCLSKLILPFQMERNVLFHVLLSPSE